MKMIHWSRWHLKLSITFDFLSKMFKMIPVRIMMLLITIFRTRCTCGITVGTVNSLSVLYIIVS